VAFSDDPARVPKGEKDLWNIIEATFVQVERESPCLEQLAGKRNGPFSCVERLDDRDERYLMRIEEFDRLGEVASKL
jgi:hypothetical protein